MTCPDMSGGRCAQSDSAGARTGTVHMSIWFTRRDAHWHHDWTARVRRRCGFMSNYFDRLLFLLGRIAELRRCSLLLQTE